MHTSSFYVSWTLSLLFLTVSVAAVAVSLLHAPTTTPLASDAMAILAFKSKADLDAKLPYTLSKRCCQWRGVKCSQGRVVRFVVQGIGLRGVFAPDSLSRIDELRVLSLRNNSLAGPLPDLAGLFNLKSLFLDHNFFSGSFPSSLLSLHRLLFLDLSHNNLTGPIPPEVTGLDLLNYLRLDGNRFNGTVPAVNQSSLRIFNVSSNNLTGAIPVTPTLSRFGISSFTGNPSLCGEIIDKACRLDAPFFRSPSAAAASPPTPLLQSAQSEGVVISPPSRATKHKRVGVVLGSVIGALILIAAILCIFALLKRHREDKRHSQSAIFNSKAEDASGTDTIITAQVVNTEQEPKLETIQLQQRGQKSGKLIFCAGETEMYSLEQLMTASAELLGRGTIGTTYKAVMENRLVVTVKRLDAGKTAATSGEVFEQHMEMVGGLRHPNLVPVRAYFQAKEERLIIYDYQPNGSLFNLIHGSRSTRAKPLHWTSCLKIAEDVARGLAYMHQASRLIHGNLKSSNVLLGPDFEACLTDYCLATLADSSSGGDPDSEGYKAPEIRKSGRRPSTRSDIYAFGILLLELLTGKPPSQHPFLAPPEMPDWVRAMREDDFEEDNWLGLLVEVASICSLTSPEQRPLMRQVLEMIQEIKERITVEDDTRNRYN